jgi:RNA-directed DNA polymerase
MTIPTTENSDAAAQEPHKTAVRELLLPPKLRTLREKLRAKAKQQPGFRFYSLYGQLLQTEVLRAAWAQVRANGGAPGVDRMTIEQVDASEESVCTFLEQIASELKTRTYRAGPVRRVYIPKPNGKLRPLGIPNLKDRVVQTAVLLLLEPIFEVDFMDCSHGFRPGRNAHGAIGAIKTNLEAGRTAVYDADLSSYFDTIPHDKLMACVRMRVVDGGILALLRAWLEAPVVEPPGGKSGGPPTVGRHKQGTPQGGVISPLLANVYLHWFDKVFHRPDGPAHFAGARLVRYADDFVVLARYMGPRIIGFVEGKLEGWMGLKLNREKTRCFDASSPGQTLDFLGYSFRYDRDLYGRDRRWWRVFPSKKTMLRQNQWLRDNISPRHAYEPLPDMIARINRHFDGWRNYFTLGHPRREMRQVNWQMLQRIARHLRRRSQRAYRVPEAESVYMHVQKLGLRLL